MTDSAGNAPDHERAIAELRAQGGSDRIDFRLQHAGARNVKAAHALLADHGNYELCHGARGRCSERPQRALPQNLSPAASVTVVESAVAEAIGDLDF